MLKFGVAKHCRKFIKEKTLHGLPGQARQ